MSVDLRSSDCGRLGDDLSPLSARSARQAGALAPRACAEFVFSLERESFSTVSGFSRSFCLSRQQSFTRRTANGDRPVIC